jgi:hypothetical protein
MLETGDTPDRHAEPVTSDSVKYGHVRSKGYGFIAHGCYTT